MQKAAAFLKNLRQEKGRTIEEVSKGTNMSPAVIRALEDGRLDGIDRVYLKGFLKLYCRFLGTNWEEFIKDYSLVFGTAIKHPYRAEQEEKSKKESFKIPSLGSIYRKYKKIILAFLYVIGAAVLLILAIKVFSFVSLKFAQMSRSRATQVNAPKAKKDNPKVQKNTVIPVNTKAQKKVPVPQVVSAPTVGAAQDKISRAVSAGILIKESTLVKVALDGQVIYQGVMRKGAKESWQAKERIELSIGNAAGVELESEGKRFAPLGKKGQSLKNIVINREGVSIK